MSVKIQVRRGTASEWATANPILDIGELGYDSTNDILKVGDGVTAWESLADSDDQTAAQTTYSNSTSSLAATTVQAAIDEVDLRIDTIEADENTVGSIAKALKDAKDYADQQDALQDDASEISYDAAGQTYATGSTVQAAIYAVDDELISLDGRLDTVEGDDQTTGSIAKALKDAKDYADQQDALQDDASEISYVDTSQTYALGNNVQAAIYAIDDELIAQDGRLDTIEGDANTAGSIAKAEADAKAYADAQIDIAKLALGTNFSVADIAARDALEDLTVGDIIFVADDGDTKWAQYKVTVADPLAFLKIMDQDVLINALNAAGIKTAYESNEDTNAFTDALLGKLNGIEENATADQNAADVSYDNITSGLVGGSVQAAIDEVEGRVDTAESDITAVEGRLDVIEDDDETPGSIAKALKDAKDYTDQEVAKYDEASEIDYDNTTSGLVGGTVQAAIDEVEGRVDTAESDITAVEGRLDTIEGSDATTGSILKALKDAKDYTDQEVAKYDEADEIFYDQTGKTYTVGANVQAALDAVDSELISVDGRFDTAEGDISAVEGRLDTIEGDVTTSGSILKAIDDSIGVTVQGFNSDTVIDANYETFDPSGTYTNLRAQATTAEDVGLGNVANESKATMFTDPTFTGTVTGVTASHVGLGNVTNESKATMFTDPTFTGSVTITSVTSLTGLPDPINTTDAANKRYVDEIAEGLKTAPAAEVATTVDLGGTYNNGTAGVGATLNLGPAATLGIDGDSTKFLHDVILVKDQTNKAENGTYTITQLGDISTDWILTRHIIADEADEIPGRYTFIKGGDTHAGTGWVQIVDDPDTFVVGTDDIEVYQFSGAGVFTAGSGLNLDSNEFSLSGDSFDAEGTFASLRAQATTKGDVGLDNVTNDAQVKKLSSSTSGNVPAWDGTSGDALTDGYTVQTTLSSSTTALVRADAIITALLDKANRLANIVTTSTSPVNITNADADKVFVFENSSALTVNLPNDATATIPIGTQIAFIRNGTSTVTFAGTGTILSDASKKSIKARYTSAAVVKVAANTWQLVGNLAT